jgi:hypothetical protein
MLLNHGHNVDNTDNGAADELLRRGASDSTRPLAWPECGATGGRDAQEHLILRAESRGRRCRHACASATAVIS